MKQAIERAFVPLGLFRYEWRKAKQSKQIPLWHMGGVESSGINRTHVQQNVI